MLATSSTAARELSAMFSVRICNAATGSELLRLSLGPGDRVLEAKAAVAARLEAPAELLVLLRQGEVLHDELHLEAFGGDELQLIRQRWAVQVRNELEESMEELLDVEAYPRCTLAELHVRVAKAFQLQDAMQPVLRKAEAESMCLGMRHVILMALKCI